MHDRTGHPVLGLCRGLWNQLVQLCACECIGCSALQHIIQHCPPAVYQLWSSQNDCRYLIQDPILPLPEHLCWPLIFLLVIEDLKLRLPEEADSAISSGIPIQPNLLLLQPAKLGQFLRQCLRFSIHLTQSELYQPKQRAHIQWLPISEIWRVGSSLRKAVGFDHRLRRFSLYALQGILREQQNAAGYIFQIARFRYKYIYIYTNATLIWFYGTDHPTAGTITFWWQTGLTFFIFFFSCKNSWHSEEHTSNICGLMGSHSLVPH